MFHNCRKTHSTYQTANAKVCILNLKNNLEWLNRIISSTACMYDNLMYDCIIAHKSRYFTKLATLTFEPAQLSSLVIVLSIDLLTQTSIEIISVSWPTKMPIMVSVIGFKFWTDKDFILQVIVTLTFDLLTPKSKGIIYGSWPFMIPITLTSWNKFEVNKQTRLLTPDERTTFAIT